VVNTSKEAAMHPVPGPKPKGRVAVVVGVDFTDASAYALTVAKSLVRGAGSEAELHAIHVAHSPAVPGAVMGVLPDLGPMMTATTEEARTRLLDACHRAGDDSLAVVVTHVLFGDPVIEIADLAREVGADLIVIGARRRKGLSRALHRSISARLARRAPCSVFTALPKEVPAEATIEPPCEDCLLVQRESAGSTLWCQRHASHHLRGHIHHGASDPFAVGSWTFRT
jgi:nucleotide-binding universal stress UspA family protein